MTDSETDAHESTDLDDRTRRALTEPLSVLTPDGFPIDDPNRTVVRVTSHSGEDYVVDVREGRCSCPDYEYNLPTDDGQTRCKHLIRAAVALGREPVAADTLAAVDPDTTLGANAPGPRVATTDGGLIDAGDDAEILTSDDTGDDRPDDCRCDALGGDLPCWACWSAGFRETAATSD